jgi:hypothetical protein
MGVESYIVRRLTPRECERLQGFPDDWTLIPYKGKITFWGEIDRQHLLPHATTAEIDAAVREVYAKLWDNGGCVAQLEFGPGAKPENAYQAYKTWQELRP